MPTEPRTERISCGQCNGGGEITLHVHPEVCPRCDGNGYVEAIRLPLASGLWLVVEPEALHDAAEAALKEQSKLDKDEWDECGWEGIDTWDEAVELLRGAMLAGLPKLFPAGVVVASTVGVVGMDNGVPVLWPHDKSEPQYLMARIVALKTADG